MASTGKTSSLIRRQLKPSLSLPEITFYSVTWVLGVAYIIYMVFLAGRRHTPAASTYRSKQDPGWLGIWQNDTSDFMWNALSANVITSLPWLLVHLVGSQLLKKFHSKMLPLFYAVHDATYLLATVGINGFLLLSLPPLVLFPLYLTGKPALAYVGALSLLVLRESWPLSSLASNVLGSDRRFVAMCCFGWVTLRCLSFCLDRLWEDDKSLLEKDVGNGGLSSSSGRSVWSHQFLSLIAYCFYLPVVVIGPIIKYNEFHAGMTSAYIPWSRSRCLEGLLLAARYAFWLLINHLVLHVLHFQTLQNYVSIVRQFDLWTLCGMVICVLTFHNMKERVLYGWSRSFLLADNMEAPSPTKCLLRMISVTSFVWRNFDNGMYLFNHKYFYHPVAKAFGNGLVARWLAAAVAFGFIYIWHGMSRNVLIWTTLNFLNIGVEATGKAVANCYTPESAVIGPRGRRRLYCMFAAPLAMLSLMSNAYYLMGVEIGHHFVEQCCFSWPLGTILILCFLYCSSQFAVEVSNWEVRKQLEKKEDRAE